MAVTNRTLVCDLTKKAWYYDNYTPGVVMHSGEEGKDVHDLFIGTTGEKLYQYTGYDDDGTAIACSVQTPSRDAGDVRDNKLYGDVMLDMQASGVTITVTPYFNNQVVFLAPQTTTTTGRDIVSVDVSSAWQTYRNISVLLEFSVNSSSRPLLYAWEPRWTFESAPLSALSWEISPTTFGMDGYKHAGLVRLTHVSTANLSLTYTIDGVAQTPITIPNSGGAYKQDIFRVPVMKGKLWKMRLSSSTSFRLDTRDSFFAIKDWSSDGPYQELRVFGDFSLVEG